MLLKFTHCSVQVDYIDYVLTPLWQQMARLFPGLRDRFDCLSKNRAVPENGQRRESGTRRECGGGCQAVGVAVRGCGG